LNNIITLDGHVSRALDFYNKADNTYFVIGRTSAWDNELVPPVPDESTKIEEIIGYKKIDLMYMLIPDEDGDVVHKGNIYKKIKAGYEFCLLNSEFTVDTNELELKACPTTAIESGDKIRINKQDIYTVDSFDNLTNIITTVEDASESYAVDTVVEFGSIAEGSNLVYVQGLISYDELPLQSFRQVGVVTDLTPIEAVLVGQKALLPEEVINDGILEIVENRTAVNRAIDQRENISLIIEF